MSGDNDSNPPIERSAYDELEALLEKNNYQGERLVVVSNQLWGRLQSEVHDPFGQHGDKISPVIWYRSRTMLFPAGRCLNLGVPLEGPKDEGVPGYVQAFVVGPDDDLDAEPRKGFRVGVAFVPLSRKAELEGEHIHVLHSLQNMTEAIFWYDDSKVL